MVEILRTGPEGWNQRIQNLPDPHILQTEQWARVKSKYDWQPDFYTWIDDEGKLKAAALVLRRNFSILGRQLPIRVLYVPKGPILDWTDTMIRQQVVEDLEVIACRQKALFIKIDPDVRLSPDASSKSPDQGSNLGAEISQEITEKGWVYSPEQIQFKNTVVLDLFKPGEQLLIGMKQKTRYNIRLAERKGVHIRLGNESDLEYLYQLYAETAIRDGFTIRERNYYLTLWSTFIQSGLAEPLIAEVNGEVVAGIIIFFFARKSWYLFGMSSGLHREKMPNYLLQWHAILRAQEHGCLSYDLWGAPDQFNELDPLWGVYRFKEGLGGEVVRHIGAWDFPVNPYLYRIYSQVLPKILSIMRWRGKYKTQQSLQEV